ncbi:MAG: fibronectin type III domain-containing protein [Deltaproteobacteria bacterium]|jgi:hypothetical protein|nr:fibronectin type III domain-containing protein [Deltaproteobacteria bacterium]
MNARSLLIATFAFATTLVIGSSHSSPAQILPTTKPAEHVKIIQGPNVESAVPNMAILRWTSSNPGGPDEHYAVAHYGTDPGHLSETAKSHIRLNRNHPDTVFRVRLIGLKPQTTYYYWVTSMGADGINDPAKSDINQFTTPPPGKVIKPDTK